MVAKQLKSKRSRHKRHWMSQIHGTAVSDGEGWYVPQPNKKRTKKGEINGK